jgi:5-methylcytosine-specific restriction endonuclease McrA
MDKRLLKIGYKNKLAKLTNNQIAIVFKSQSKHFLNSKEWKDLKKVASQKYGVLCKFCGSAKCINFDHILPRKYYPELALDLDNIQPLCAKCNKAKGNKVMSKPYTY